MNDKMVKQMLETLKLHGTKLIENENDFIFKIVINIFNDGEYVDLGARIVVCDFAEDNFRNTYCSFIFGEDEMVETVLNYIKEVGSVNEYQRQKNLAGCLKESLLECSWIDDRTYICIEEYD